MPPPGVRTAAAGFPVAFATALFGGTARYPHTWLVSTRRAGYVILLLLVNAYTVRRMTGTEDSAPG